MKIGIDIDDVITDTSASMKDYIIKYDKNGELLENIEDIMRGDASTPFIEKFFAEHFLDIARNAKVKENAARIIKKLLDSGHEIYLITARGEKRKIFKGAEALTLDYLKSNHICYTNIIFDAVDKAGLCKDYQIDLMIDDSIKHCEAVRNENIKSILFTSIVNKSLSTTVERVDNWLELEEKINNMI
ncbi:MAG: hypothetical protein J6A04_06735 [Clostridia bacterium]|nr:hypothetical protein [Clostridia bacterium]